jgi:uncharacterized membrane protein (DUF4010 family)
MYASLTSLEVADHLALALALAVFVGLAFEAVYKREPHAIPGGIRTFPLLTVLGAMLFLIDPPSLWPFLVGLGAVALWLYAHLRSEYARGGDRPTLVVPAVNALAYAFGPAALTQPLWLLVAAAVGAVLLMESREPLHRLAQRVPNDEIYTLGKFLILVGVILPLMPDRPIVLWTPITPLEVWLALVAISTLSYVSYLLQRYLPASGALTPAILGGAYSSTATTVALAREQKQSVTPRPELAVGIVIATAIMYLRIDVVVALFNRPLAWLLLPRVAVLAAFAAALATWQWLRGRSPTRAAPAKLPESNPLQLSAAFAFAGLFVLVALASSWVRSRFGNPGVYVLGGVAGVSDINPFVLSLAQGSAAGMSVAGVAAAILIAAASNNAMNAVYALAFGGSRACLKPALALLATAAVGLSLALLTLPH